MDQGDKCRFLERRPAENRHKRLVKRPSQDVPRHNNDRGTSYENGCSSCRKVSGTSEAGKDESAKGLSRKIVKCAKHGVLRLQ